MNEKMRKNIIRAFPLIIPPLAIMIVMLVSFYENRLYPFGNGTIAWCDMTQQVIPLIADFKDMLSGKTGIFLNLQNAGGMSMWGVIFFFVASPFTLLACFVDKDNLVLFVNVLTMIKLMVAGFTAALFFKTCMKKLNWYIASGLSVAYAFCGFGLMYYQNNIWLDVMYLFPLLIISFEMLIKKQRCMPYIIVMSLMAVINYYICYMVVIFSLLFVALVCCRYRKDMKYVKTGMKFCLGSAIAACTTAVVWFPSLLQYLSSGRKKSIVETLENSSFTTSFETVLPLIMATASSFIVCAICFSDGKSRSKKLNTYLIMLFMMFVPIFIEPVNLMWHTGSYMSFPCRFSFITIFILLICTGLFLSEDSSHCKAMKSKTDSYLVLIVGAALAYGVMYISNKIIFNNNDAVSHYAGTLWGDSTSLSLITKIFVVTVTAFGIIFLIYKRGRMSTALFAVFLGVFVIIEGYSNLQIYLAYPNYQDVDRAVPVQTAFDLSDRINDDSFYRVKADSKLFEVNNIGAMGYRSISHYTSLTDKDYMFAMKKLGYSSYWMEVGSHGGTAFTDALLSIGYRISSNESGLAGSDVVYKNGDYSISKNKDYVGLGLVTDRDLSSTQSLDGLTRAEVQEKLYDSLFADNEDDKLVSEYAFTSAEAVKISESSSGYNFSVNGKSPYVTFSIHVNGKQTLYFDCFDVLSNNLTEDINNSFEIYVNNKGIQGDYPSQSSNGLINLGDFENEDVIVKLVVKKDLDCKSFGLFGIDNSKLDETISSVKCANLNEKGGKITGNYTAQNGEKCVLFVPYTDNFTVKVNGHSVEYSKVFDDFISFDLQEGNNDIEITSTPRGFVAGVIISIIGVVSAVVILILKRKFAVNDKIPEKLYAAFNYIVIGVGVIVVFAIYLVPIYISTRQIIL